jgi:D-alanyl-lipoteichoic acid acyltransferase DltB (MBOAT superfamily)
MSIYKLLILLAAALLLGQIRPGRRIFLLMASVAAIFWLQPVARPVSLIFWLPVTTLGLVSLCWVITAAPEVRTVRANWPAVLTMVGVSLLFDLNRYFKFEQIFSAVTPRPIIVVVVLVGIIVGLLGVAVLRRWERVLLPLALAGLLSLFLLVKIPALPSLLWNWGLGFRNPVDASVSVLLAWLGYSYIAFRLIHTIRDRQTGRLPAVTLDEYVTYVIFFPTLIAGPIDRLERFVTELRQPLKLDNDGWLFVIYRIVGGMFKKFVVADLLYIIALRDDLVPQIHSTGWMWVLVYAYAFQIYCDFSGYTDIALGAGRLLGFRLPENFSSPYTKPNITQFWNNWHMTLTQWFRAYYFNPLTRSLRGWKIPTWSILILTQISTMALIGLWHGVSWNFLLWGLWHGLGLFIHNRWSEWMRGRIDPSAWRPAWRVLWGVSGALLTFHFVALGWVFFALETPALSLSVMRVLLGIVK